MKKTCLNPVLILCILLQVSACSLTSGIETSAVKQVLWPIDNIKSIGGYATEISGQPKRIKNDPGNSIIFGGSGDRLLVANNPLDGASEFTIEIVFKQNDSYPDNTEPRFFHIESDENPDRRVTIELRLNDAQQWYLDAFIKSDISKYTLVDQTLTHPVAVWSHAAVTYKDRVFTSYVNGVKELSAGVDYLPIPASAKTSIGARMNEIHWFNGAIAYIAVSHKAMQPDEFAILDMARNPPVDNSR